MADNPVGEWLAGLGLGEYVALFDGHRIAMAQLPGLSEQRLEALGIQRLGHRMRLRDAIAELAHGGRSAPLPEGLDPESLPTYLAAPVAALLAEQHPRVRLHLLIDCAEIALCWSVALALAETIQAGQGALPEPVPKQICGQIEHPTFGKWRAMLAALSKRPPAEPLLVPGVFHLYGDVFAPRMRSSAPLGRDELVSQSPHLAAFRDLFRLDAPSADTRTRGDLAPLPWRGLIDEAKQHRKIHGLYGRDAHLDRLARWWRATDEAHAHAIRIAWVFGAPGVGKSLLCDRLAVKVFDGRGGDVVYYHAFRGNDPRNSPRAFALGLLDALAATWPDLADAAARAKAAATPGTPPDDGDRPEGLRVAGDSRLFEVLAVPIAALPALPPRRPNAPRPWLRVLIDGLDVVLPQASWLPNRLRELALPATCWLTASRPCDDLLRLAERRGCTNLFPGGLPLYIRLLLDDLRAGQLTVNEEHKLPPGLIAYYDTLIERIGLSDSATNRPPRTNRQAQRQTRCPALLSGDRIALCERGGWVRIRSLKIGEGLREFQAPGTRMLGVTALSNECIVVRLSGRLMQVWDIATERLTGTLSGHAQGIRQVRELEDGRLLSIGNAGELCIWNRTVTN